MFSFLLRTTWTHHNVSGVITLKVYWSWINHVLQGISRLFSCTTWGNEETIRSVQLWPQALLVVCGTKEQRQRCPLCVLTLVYGGRSFYDLLHDRWARLWALDVCLLGVHQRELLLHQRERRGGDRQEDRYPPSCLQQSHRWSFLILWFHSRRAEGEQRGSSVYSTMLHLHRKVKH